MTGKAERFAGRKTESELITLLVDKHFLTFSPNEGFCWVRRAIFEHLGATGTITVAGARCTVGTGKPRGGLNAFVQGHIKLDIFQGLFLMLKWIKMAAWTESFYPIEFYIFSVWHQTNNHWSWTRVTSAQRWSRFKHQESLTVSPLLILAICR